MGNRLPPLSRFLIGVGRELEPSRLSLETVCCSAIQTQSGLEALRGDLSKSADIKKWFFY